MKTVKEEIQRMKASDYSFGHTFATEEEIQERIDAEVEIQILKAKKKIG